MEDAVDQAVQALRQLIGQSVEADRLSRLRAAVVAFGFEHERTVGSHRHYVHPSVPHILTINPGKDAKRYQVRRMLDIIEEFGLSMDE